MNDLRTSASIRAETEPTVQAQLTRIRGTWLEIEARRMRQALAISTNRLESREGE